MEMEIKPLIRWSTLISITVWTYCMQLLWTIGDGDLEPIAWSLWSPSPFEPIATTLNHSKRIMNMEVATALRTHWIWRWTLNPLHYPKLISIYLIHLNQLQLLWSWIIRAENGDWTTHCNTALNYLEMETHCMIYFNLHLCTALKSNNFVFLLCMHSGFIISLNFAVCHPWRTLWNSNQMGTSSCTVFLLRFSLNTLYIRLVFIKTQNLPVGILGMNFVFSSLHTSWSRILCTWC